MAEEKAADAYVVCSSIQSVARNLEGFKPHDFGIGIQKSGVAVDYPWRFWVQGNPFVSK